MSFVSIIAKKEFITVVSDGKVSDLETKKVKQNDYQKFKKISPKQFIAYTGIKEYCEVIVEQFPYNHQVYELSFLAKQIENNVKSEPFNKYRLHFAIGGINTEGKIAFYTIVNHGDTSINYYQPKSNNDVNYVFMDSGHGPDPKIVTERLIGLLRKTGYNTPQKCITAQTLLSQYISMNDQTVNKKTFSLEIKK